MVASTGPGLLVGRGEQGVDLGGGEELDDRPDRAPWRDREDLGDGGGMLGMLRQSAGEDRTDRGQSGVASLGAVASLVFEVKFLT